MSRLWILGAPDPEMAAIETLLQECGETVAYATIDGARVHAGNAYRAECPGELQGGMGERLSAVYRVECMWDPSWESLACPVHVIDHHRPGDPGYGRPPAEFLAASSLGQVVAELARVDALRWSKGIGLSSRREPGHFFVPRPGGDSGWTVESRILSADFPADALCLRVPAEIVLTAAADHCLGAAYRGDCPGVDLEELMRYRTEQRAAIQGRTVEELLADIEATRAALMAAPVLHVDSHTHTEDHNWSRSVCEGCARELAEPLRDMRRETPWPELPEAATREGIGYMSGPLIGPDGRRKFTCSGTAEQVRAWLNWADDEGLVELYGDPARGFAGGYEAPS